MSRSPSLLPIALLESLYSVLDDRTRWPVFLEGLCTHLGTTYAGIVSYGPASAPRLLRMFKWGISDETAHEYYTRWAGQDPWATRGNLLAYPPGTLAVSHEVCPDEILEGTEVYQKFLKERGHHYGAAAILDVSEHIATGFGTLRPKESGPLTAEEVERVRCIVPHIQRVVRLQDRIDELETRRGLLQDIFDRTAIGIALLDQSGAVIATNAQADAILERGVPLYVREGQLRAAEKASDEELRRAIRSSVDRFDASHSDGRLEGEMISLRDRRRNEKGEAASHFMRVWVVPAKREQMLTPSSRTACAIVQMIDPGAGPAVDRKTLQRVFSLSNAEADVAWHLASGLSAAEVADYLHVSHHTVRSHLKSLFRKTGTAQQSALVSQILRLQAQVPKRDPAGHSHGER